MIDKPPEPRAIEQQRRGNIAVIERERRQRRIAEIERAVDTRMFDADTARRRQRSPARREPPRAATAFRRPR